MFVSVFTKPRLFLGRGQDEDSLCAPPGSLRALAGTMGFNTWHTTAPPPSVCFASWSRDPCVFPCQPELQQAVSLHTCRDGEPALRLTLQGQEPGKASAPFRSGRRCFLLGLPGSPPPSAGLLCSAPDGPGSLTSCPQPGSLTTTGAVSPGAWAGRPSSFSPPPSPCSVGWGGGQWEQDGGQCWSP